MIGLFGPAGGLVSAALLCLASLRFAMPGTRKGYILLDVRFVGIKVGWKRITMLGLGRCLVSKGEYGTSSDVDQGMVT